MAGAYAKQQGTRKWFKLGCNDYSLRERDVGQSKSLMLGWLPFEKSQHPEPNDPFTELGQAALGLPPELGTGWTSILWLARGPSSSERDSKGPRQRLPGLGLRLGGRSLGLRSLPLRRPPAPEIRQVVHGEIERGVGDCAVIMFAGSSWPRNSPLARRIPRKGQVFA